jgi:uncharacterized protein YndB with AHSA1/START domain
VTDGTSVAQPSVTITRVFDAPREMVYRAWIEPEQLTRWWGPRIFTVPVETIEVDPRPGGVFRFTMVSREDGSEHPAKGIFREIEQHERLVWVFPAADNPHLPIDGESIVTVEFVDLGGKTEVRLTQAGLSPDILASAKTGWTEQLERLVEFLDRN